MKRCTAVACIATRRNGQGGGDSGKARQGSDKAVIKGPGQGREGRAHSGRRTLAGKTRGVRGQQEDTRMTRRTQGSGHQEDKRRTGLASVA